MQRGPSAEINLISLRRNYRSIKGIAGGRPVIAVVKADAYGHGSAEVARALQSEGVFMLAVAFISEALALREAGIDSPILVLFDSSEPDIIIEHSLTPAVHSFKEAEWLSKEAERRGRPLGIHVKLDTGMGRMGISGADQSGADQSGEVLKIAGLPFIKITGLMSHISEAGPGDLSFAHEQLARFNSVRERLAVSGIAPLCHIASSASTLLMPASHLDAVRTGLILYGGLPFEENSLKYNLEPVMKIKTRILAIKKYPAGTPVSYDRTFVTRRDSLIAVLPVGYADGYLRSLSNRGEVLVRGETAPVSGRVCMDLTMADVTAIEGVSEGDEAVLLGDEITACSAAERAGTNSYEILTSFGGGARRRYLA